MSAARKIPTNFEIVLYFSVNGKLDHWIVEEQNDRGRVLERKNTWAVIAEKEQNLAKYPERLHPLLKDYLLPQPQGQQTKSVLDMLYFLKANEQTIKVDAWGEGADVRTYVLPHGKYFMPKNAHLAHYTPVDQLIAMIRKKNQTYAKLNEIHETFDHIMDVNRFPSAGPLTQQKTDILHDFNEFRIRHGGEAVSRSKLVEDWVNEYDQKHGVSPFKALSEQRRTGALSLFNPKMTDSMAFFHKFLRGESVSDALKGYLNLEQVKSERSENRASV